MLKIFLRVVFFGLLWVAAGVAHAGPIGFSTWYQFSFDTSVIPSVTGCMPASQGDPGDPAGQICAPSSGATTVFADAPAWTFTVGSAGATLKVTDAFYSGDSFLVNNFGAPLLTTLPQDPVAFDDTDPNVILGVDCGDDPDSCFGVLGMSFGSLDLAAGAYSLTIKVNKSVAFTGSAFFEVVPNGTQIPAPGTLALMLLALLGLAWTQLKNRGVATSRRTPINPR